MLPLAAPTADALAAAVEPAVRVFAEKAVATGSGDHLAPAAQPFALDMQCHGGQYCLDVAEAGAYAVFCEHAPAEFGLHFPAPAQAERAFASHHHDNEITSIGISDARALDARKVNDWLSYLLQSRGEDILRMKGVLNLRGDSRRYVFHGVHMMFDGRPDLPWGETPRRSQLVFIGRKLDRQELEAGFASCLAS